MSSESDLLDELVESIADVSPPVFSWLKRVGVDPLGISASARIRLERTPQEAQS